MHKNFMYLLYPVSLFFASCTQGAERSVLFTAEFDNYLRAQYAAMKEQMDAARERAREHASQPRQPNLAVLTFPCASESSLKIAKNKLQARRKQRSVIG